MTALLSVHDLGCRYGTRQVLRGVCLEVGAGEVVGLVGPNGAGKSSLIKCLNGIQRHSAGQVRVAGKLLADYGRRELARTVAYVPQHKGSAMSLRVIDMVALGRLPHQGLSSADDDQARMLDAIDQLGLHSLALRLFSELSGGERQRVLMARALAQQGRLLLLDEPTSDLDLRHQLATLSTVQTLAATQGLGALIAIHDLGLAARFCHRLVMLHGGAVHAQGRWQSVLTPAHLATVYGVVAQVVQHGGVPAISALSALPGNGAQSTLPDIAQAPGPQTAGMQTAGTQTTGTRPYATA